MCCNKNSLLIMNVHVSAYLNSLFLSPFSFSLSHAQVLGATLVREFQFFYNRTEWNLLFSLVMMVKNSCCEVQLNYMYCKLKSATINCHTFVVVVGPQPDKEQTARERHSPSVLLMLCCALTSVSAECTASLCVICFGCWCGTVCAGFVNSVINSLAVLSQCKVMPALQRASVTVTR